MGFNERQVRQLLAPIHPARVLRDGKGHSHVSQQDVTAHLIRVFGFGNFDVETLELRCLYETPREKDGRPTGRFDVCYLARVRLTVKDEHGQPVARYEDGSTGMAQNQTRGDGHDLAMKAALSLAKKRAAINLGDQFGLSLYNKGQMEALVRGTLVEPAGVEAETPEDMQEGVPQQVTLGHDETAYEHDETPAETPAQAGKPSQNGNGQRQNGRAPAPEPADHDPAVVKAHTIAATKAADLGTLRATYDEAAAAGTLHAQIPDPDGDKGTFCTLAEFITRRRGQLAA